MKFGFIIPGGGAKEIVNLASEAEKEGWDGVFFYDSIYIKGLPQVHSAWPILSAIAVTTKRVTIGSVLTAIGRRRPWEVAREAITVDHLSNGRLVLPVGLGTLDDGGYSKVGMDTSRKIRAEMLDEGLEIIVGLWSGKPFSYEGKHFKMGEMTFKPSPLQKPRIPIWVVGAWGRPKSMARVLKYDGLIPAIKKKDGSFEQVTAEKIREMREYFERKRVTRTTGKRKFEIIQEGQTPTDKRKSRKIVLPFAEAGATWWMESMWSYKSLRDIENRIKAGPPIID